MDGEEVIKWLKIMKANLNSFPEVSSEKKIKALAEAIRLLKNEQSENMNAVISNLQLGDTYYTEDGYGEVTGYIFVARQGQFIIGVAEYWNYSIVDQLHQMCEETLEEEGVNMYIHYAKRCYPTYEEAEKNRVGSEEE